MTSHFEAENIFILGDNYMNNLQKLVIGSIVCMLCIFIYAGIKTIG